MLSFILSFVSSFFTNIFNIFAAYKEGESDAVAEEEEKGLELQKSYLDISTKPPLSADDIINELRNDK